MTQVTPLLEKCFPFVVRFCSPPIMLPHPDKHIFFSDLPCESAATVLEMIQSGVKTQRAAESPSGACVSL